MQKLEKENTPTLANSPASSHGLPSESPQHASKLIDLLVKKALVPLMTSVGFRTSGANFWRESPNSIEVLNIQKSQWNDFREASFYINLGVYWKAYHRDKATEFTSKFPREYDCTVFSRVLEPHVKAWTVHQNSDLDAVADLLTREIQNTAFQWFDQLKSESGILGYLKAQGLGLSFENWLATKAEEE